MVRVASLTLVIGAVLLLSWVIAPAPAAPHQQTAAPPAPDTEWANLTTHAAAVADPRADIDHLRERLAAPPAFRAPSRDPFAFAHRSAAAPAAGTADAPSDAAAPLPSAPPPRLVAILSNVVNGGVVRRAAFAAGGAAMRVVGVGESIDLFTVRAIDADAVELADRVTGAVTRCTLR